VAYFREASLSLLHFPDIPQQRFMVTKLKVGRRHPPPKVTSLQLTARLTDEYSED
jgi:hypothetical protein